MIRITTFRGSYWTRCSPGSSRSGPVDIPVAECGGGGAIPSLVPCLGLLGQGVPLRNVNQLADPHPVGQCQVWSTWPIGQLGRSDRLSLPVQVVKKCI